jgi:hypothetical protein
LNILTPPVCCSHSAYHTRYGRTWQWTSLRVFSHVNGKSMILIVIDRFSKLAHFIALGHPYMATSVTQEFITNIIRLHGMPEYIMSDRDLVFMSRFWIELFALAGVKLHLSFVLHPQSNGQLEATNKIITMYPRCLTGDHPRQWLQWLPWAETATTRCIRCHSGHRHSGWSTSAILRPFAPSPLGTHTHR